MSTASRSASASALVERLLRQKGIAVPGADRIVPSGADEGPLSFEQARLWLLDQLQPGASTYNVPAAFRLRGPLDVAALARALEGVVRRHAALRTTFAVVDGEPVQRIAPAAPVPLPVREVTEDQVAAALDEAARAPFDLARGPLFRAGLLRIAADEHVLVFCAHHAVFDGWSLGVLVRELGALYAAARAGREAALPGPAVQYVDYARWQRERMRGEAGERQGAYWRERLRGAPALLDLPADRPRPPARSDRGGTVEFRVPAQASERLAALARREGATLFAVLLAAFTVLLSRLSGQDDVVVGTPAANRTRGELEGVIGFLVNTLALRTDLSGDPTFLEVVARVRETTLGAYAHQELPFDRLVEELGVPRTLAATPVFQAMFILQNAPGGGTALDGEVRLEPVEVGTGTAKFDLLVAMEEGPDGVRGWLEYAEDLFDRDTAERMAERFVTLLAAAAADPAAPVRRLPLMRQAERRRVLAEWNATAREWPGAAAESLHGAFEARARRAPGETALLFAGARTSCGELNARANRVAHRLLRLGVGPEARVAVCMERGPEAVAALLGVLKAGAAYVPMDPAYPAERLEHMLRDSGAAVLLTQERLREGMPSGPAVVCVDGAGAESLAGEPDHDPGVPVHPEGAAYVVYTSGSTGLPKGVMGTHGAALNRFRWMWDAFPFARGEVCAQKTALGFVDAVWEILGPLAGGAVLAVLPAGVERDPARLAQALAEGGATRVVLVPSLLQALLEGGPPVHRALRGVRLWTCSGEALPPALAASFARALPDAALLNLYGSSEVAADATWHLVTGAPSATVPIGRPMANVRTYVLDSELQASPIGVPGELYVGGAGVARGYLGRPGLTAERFLPDPFGGTGERMYRTGDRARWLASGELEFLGRVDQQVKLRGVRIEPGEIEAALRLHPAVRESVVVLRHDAPGEPRLAAYVVPAEDGGDADAAALRAHLAARLPEHMVPAAFVRMGALPLTPNGKLDRGALPAPDGTALARGAYVAPRTPAEETLCAIWAEVLGTERVGVEEDFFALGGHSLMATRVAARVRDALGAELPLRAFFEAPTVAALARRLASAPAAGGPPLVRVPRDGDLPASFSQQRLWLLEQMEPAGAAYHVPLLVRMRGGVEVDVLRRALDEAVRRHEALRTTFAAPRGEPVQRIHPPFAVPLPVHEPGGAADPDAALRAWAAEQAARPFDLERGPLFRAALLRLGEDEHVLLLALHHAVCDGWSVRLLFRELAALYAAFRRGEPSPLPEPPVQFADHAAWQRARLAGDALAEEAAWWRERLAGAPAVLELPADRPRPHRQSFRGGRHTFVVPPALQAAVRAVARREGATPFMVGLAAFKTLLARWTGAADVVVGTPVAGRTRPEVEGVVGFFADTLVLRTDLAGDPAFRELVARVRETTLGAHAHQELPFERLVEALHPARDPGRNPLFQVMFTYEAEAVAPAPGPDAPAWEMESAETGASRFDLTLSLAESGGALWGVVEYAADLFDAATVERFAEHYRTLLAAAAADPARPLARLPLMDEGERTRVLREWNATADDSPAAPLHERFAALARRAPDALALAADGERWSYAELDARANRLAHALLRRGAGPEACVAVCAERGRDTVLGLLAALKAGAAYLPLDPAHPRERLAYMARAAGARVLAGPERLLRDFPETGAAWLRLDADAAEIAREPASAPDLPVHPASLAYVIYTSGSTGAPKGVGVPHGALANVLRAQRRAFGLGGGDRYLLLAAPGFDASVFEAAMALGAGASLHAPPAETLLSGAALAAYLAEERVTAANLPPAVLAGVPHAALPALRLLTVAGEACPPALAARWAPGRRFLNLYGPTETAIWATAAEVRGTPGATVPIGRPVANVRAYVLDSELEASPIGVPGELYVGGAGVARGYLGRPGLTAERFLPDPFAAEPGARMYRTGDRARWLASGELEFLGRVDQQVKLRGVRIEPGEIEAALRLHPAVRESVVVLRHDAPGEPRLAAYVVPAEDGGDADAAALRAHLAARLPEHMVPAAFVRMWALPLTPNGKLDRGALPPPDGTALARGAYVAPRTPAEEALCGIWAEVLGLERVGVEEDFFALGGHSLMATRVAARVREALGAELPLRAFFDAPTVAALAERLHPAEAEPAPIARRGNELEAALEGIEGMDAAQVDALLGRLLAQRESNG